MRLEGMDVGAKGPAGVRDGNFQIGFRAHQLHLEKPAPNAFAIPAKVAVTEITGSESFIHVDALGERWTALTHGVHPYDAGDEIALYLNPADCMFFDTDGVRVEAD